MADTKLVLGSFVFSAMEIPESILFGGAQRLVTHKLPGGARVVQAMGRDDAPLAWSGLFLGDQARDRALYVDYLRVQGKPLKLTWDQFQYTVVIESFNCAFERFYKLPYQISCMVVSDDAAPTETYALNGYDAAILGDNTLAQSLGASIGDGTLSGLLGTMDTAIRSVSSFAAQAQSAINGILAPVAAVQSRVAYLIGTTTNTINNVATLGGLLPNSSLAQKASRLTSQLTSATQLPLLSQLASVSGRITSNLTAINGSAGNSGGAFRTIQAAGGTLFDMAAKVYGDATKWTALAKANNMTDPNIAVVGPLNVPNNPADNGGVLTQ